MMAIAIIPAPIAPIPTAPAPTATTSPALAALSSFSLIKSRTNCV